MAKLAPLCSGERNQGGLWTPLCGMTLEAQGTLFLTSLAVQGNREGTQKAHRTRSPGQAANS